MNNFNFENLMDMILFDYEIPLEVRNDVRNRISDWLRSGGNETDNYIKRQYDYLMRVKESKNRKLNS